MPRQLPLLAALTAWLLATGSHWDLVQTFGWGRMIATYSQTMPVAAAVRLTFTPDNLCGVCEAVAAAKQNEASSSAVPGGKLDGKVILVFSATPHIVIARPDTASRHQTRDVIPGRDRAEPAVPPPRIEA